jgi:hypothetical protein
MVDESAQEGIQDGQRELRGELCLCRRRVGLARETWRRCGSRREQDRGRLRFGRAEQRGVGIVWPGEFEQREEDLRPPPSEVSVESGLCSKSQQAHLVSGLAREKVLARTVKEKDALQKPETAQHVGPDVFTYCDEPAFE